MTAPTNAQEYGWNPTGAAWAIQNLWWHYEFTQNEDYLKNTIYPIMKEAAQFWDSYLWTSEYQKINKGNSTFCQICCVNRPVVHLHIDIKVIIPGPGRIPYCP